MMAKSDDYIYRCAEVIVNDKNISETTIITMFLEYKKLILIEKKDEKKVCKRPQSGGQGN